MIKADFSGARLDGPGKDITLSWGAPPTDLAHLTEDVHFWRAGLDLRSESIRELEKILSPDEMLRAERFRFELDASRFIAARGILRLIVARYLAVEPGSIRFCYEKGGKPNLQFCRTGIQFNLSHSEGLALYVFTRGRRVGVDIEHMRELDEMESIVERFFPVRERLFFGKLPEEEKKEKFFVWWTRTEAFGKALGEGLDSLPAEGKWNGRLQILKGAEERPGWATWDIGPAAGFAGAVVVEKRRSK